jgi:hypothetical protein
MLVLRASLVAASLAGVLAAGGCSSSPRCPPGASCPPPSLPRVTFIPTIDGKSAVPRKDGHVPRYRVRSGEYLVMRVAVTVPRHTTVTALSLGISTESYGGSPQHPIGVHLILAHSRQPLAAGLHTFRLRWRIPKDQLVNQPGASLLLVSVWSTNQPPASVAQPIAALALAQHANRQLIWGGGPAS